MENKVVFGWWEATALLLNSMCVQIFLNFPRVMAETSATAAWIMTIYMTVVAALLFYAIVRLYKPFEGLDILEISQIAGGKALKIITGIVVLAHFCIIITLILREFAEDMKVIAFAVSPISFIQLFFVSGMILGAYLGIEAIVRYHAIIIPVVIFGFILIVVGVSPYAQLNNILPVFGSGASDIFINGFFRVSSFSAVIIMFLIYPYIRTEKLFRKVGFTGIIVSGLFMTAATLMFLLVLMYPTAVENFLPIYQMARMINFGRFFQRIEAVFMLIWAASALLYLSMGFFFIVDVFKKTFNLDYYRPLIFAFSVIIFTLSLIPPNLFTVIHLESGFFRNIAWIDTFVFTAIILIIARFVKKKKEGVSKCD